MSYDAIEDRIARYRKESDKARRTTDQDIASFDASMATFTVHQWADLRAPG
jgi:hypothetical protein